MQRRQSVGFRSEKVAATLADKLSNEASRFSPIPKAKANAR